MKATRVFALGFSLLAAAVPTGAKAELENISSPLTTRASSSCEETLSCTFDQIQQTTMAQRLAYIQAIESKFLSLFNAGNQFRAIEGVITFFQEKHRKHAGIATFRTLCAKTCSSGVRAFQVMLNVSQGDIVGIGMQRWPKGLS